MLIGSTLKPTNRERGGGGRTRGLLYIGEQRARRGGDGLGLLVVRRHASEGAQYLQAKPLSQPGRDRVAHLVRVRVRSVGLKIALGMGLGMGLGFSLG